MDVFLTRLVCVCLLCVSGVGLGCAGSSETRSDIEQEPIEQPEPLAPGPIVIAADEDDNSDDPIAEHTPAVRVRVFSQSDAPPRRSDGRPLWWFDSSGESDPGSRFCVESIGSTILEARRLAVARAEEFAARDGAGGSSRIAFERIWIWPIRSTGTARDSYAAFVMARVRE